MKPMGTYILVAYVTFSVTRDKYFLPILLFCSSKVTCCPALAETIAAQSPAAPAPMIIIFSLFIGYYTLKLSKELSCQH